MVSVQGDPGHVYHKDRPFPTMLFSKRIFVDVPFTQLEEVLVDLLAPSLKARQGVDVIKKSVRKSHGSFSPVARTYQDTQVASPSFLSARLAIADVIPRNRKAWTGNNEYQ